MAITINGKVGVTEITELTVGSSADLASIISDESGTGVLAFTTSPTFTTPALGTPSSVTLTNGTGLPVSGITASTSTALGVGTLELGDVSDTTISRVSAGVVAVEGINVVTESATQTLTNKTLTAPSINGGILDEIVMNAPQERTTISATAADGTVQFDTKTQGVLFFTTTSTGDFTLNVRGDNATTLDSLMTTGDAITVIFIATNVTAFFLSALTIDSNAITPKFQNGTAFAAGSANAIDIYSITIFKTGSATFTALASQTKFA